MSIIRLIKTIKDSNVMTLAGSLCFFIVINGGSVIFLLSSILGGLINIDEIFDALKIDVRIEELIKYFFSNSYNIPTGILMILINLYSSSSLYYHFLCAVEIVIDAKLKPRHSKRAQAIVICILSTLVVIMLLWLALILYKVSKLFLIIFFILIPLVLSYLANKITLDLSVERMLWGILISYLFILIFTLLFILFLYIFKSFKAIYGYFSAIISFLIYIYFCVALILFGIKINWEKLAK